VRVAVRIYLFACISHGLLSLVHVVLAYVFKQPYQAWLTPVRFHLVTWVFLCSLPLLVLASLGRLRPRSLLLPLGMGYLLFWTVSSLPTWFGFWPDLTAALPWWKIPVGPALIVLELGLPIVAVLALTRDPGPPPTSPSHVLS
jgi:hypothetical protein